jgi:hypothetical protein
VKDLQKLDKTTLVAAAETIIRVLQRGTNLKHGKVSTTHEIKASSEV